MSTINAVAYVRYSSDNQREESIDAQLRAITEYADRNGYTITNTYADHAKSAMTDKHFELMRMIEDSQIKEFEYYICEKNNRFSKNPFDIVVLEYELKKNGVNILSVSENINNSPESFIIKSVVEDVIPALDAYYSTKY